MAVRNDLGKPLARRMGRIENAADRIYGLIDKLPNGKPDPTLTARKRTTREMAQAERDYQQAIRDGNPGRATTIITQIKTKYPEEVGKSPLLKAQTVVSTVVRDDFLKQIESELKDCDFDRAAALLARFRREHPEWRTDALVFRYARQLRSIEIESRNVDSWKTSPNRQAETKRAYEVLCKLRPACFNKEYFAYLLQNGQTKQQNENHSGAILSFQQAQRIEPKLSRQNKVAVLIARSDSVLKCRDKSNLFKQMLAQVTSAYRACDCETARKTWEESQKYICPENKTDQTAWDNWRGNVEDCEKSQRTISDFKALTSEAQTAFEEGRCQQAKILYARADSLQTRCGTLTKGGLGQAISQCDSCLKRNKFDSTMTLAGRRLNYNDKSEALTLYKQALMIAPADREKGVKRQIAQLNCDLGLPDCETVKSPVVKGPAYLVKLMPMGTFGGSSPKLLINGDQEVDVFLSPHFQVGGQLNIVSYRLPVSVRIGLQYAQYILYTSVNTNRIRERLTIGAIQIPIGIKFHTPLKRDKIERIRPYLHLSYVPTQRISFSYKNYYTEKQFSGRQFTVSQFSPVSAGVGLEKNKKRWGFWTDLTYQIIQDDVLNNFDLSSRQINSAFISAGFRFGW